MDSERTWARRSSRSRSAGLRIASLVAPALLVAPASLAALAVLVTLATLVGGCATAAPVPETAEAADRAVSDSDLAAKHDERGDALFNQGELAEATAEYQEAVRLVPTNASLWLQLGYAHERMGRVEDALHSLEKGLAADPGDARILNHLAWLYATAENPTLRDPAKALAYAQRAVEASEGSDANILDTLAEAYYANQQFDAAIETEERALELAPELEALRNQLEKFREAKAAGSGG